MQKTYPYEQNSSVGSKNTNRSLAKKADLIYQTVEYVVDKLDLQEELNELDAYDHDY